MDTDAPLRTEVQCRQAHRRKEGISPEHPARSRTAEDVIHEVVADLDDVASETPEPIFRRGQVASKPNSITGCSLDSLSIVSWVCYLRFINYSFRDFHLVLGANSGTLKRRLNLAELVRQHGEMRVDDLSSLLGVSAVTIRSDLNYLEEQGLLIRSFGKALAASQLIPKASASHAGPGKAQTAAMLRSVSLLIEANGPVLIGHGKLPKQIIPLLNGIADLHLILSDIEAVALARQCLDCNINLLAGKLGPDGATLNGPKSIQSLKFELIDTYVMEARALSSDGSLVLDDRSAGDFCLTASAQAHYTFAMILTQNMALDQTGGTVPLSHIDFVAFAAPPDLGCRELLTRSGLEQVQNTNEAPVFRRFPIPT